MRELNETGERYNLRWCSDPGYSEFLFPEFLDYTGNQAEAETKLAERVFVHNNTVWDAPRQRVMGETVTVPTIGTVPSPTTKYWFLPSFSIRIRQGLDKSKVNIQTLRAAHSTLGGKFEYRVGDTATAKNTEGQNRGTY